MRFKVALFGVLLGLGRVAEGGPGGPIELIQAKYGEIQQVVSANPEKEPMQAGIRAIMDTFVDYRELGRRALDRQWDKLNDKQRNEFVEEFKKMIQRTYVKRFNPNKKVEIEYHGDPEKQRDGTWLVKTTVRSGRSEARVDYLFLQRDKRWWAFDVIIDGVSMVKNYRKQFSEIMKREGFDGLMERIRKKNAKAGN